MYANQRTTIVEGAGTTSYIYDDAGRTTRQTVASGAYTDYGYDSRNRQTSVSHKKSDGTVLSSESYVYDDAGNMSSKTVDSTTTTYGYDNIDQLTSEARTSYSCSYTYDANGNRLSKTLNSVTESYTCDDADKMMTAGSKSYTYDSAGRTTAVAVGNDTTTLSYDYEGRLTQIAYPNSATITFTYSRLDTRVGKTDSAGTKTFKRDGVGVTDAVLSDGTSAYTPGISVRTSGATNFMHSDFQKTVTSETSSAQTTTATRTYDAFGLMVASTGSSASVFGFAGGFGYQEDPDSGLKLLGHRYYDPSTGRFLTRDPAKDGTNWYGYCANNPTSYIDEQGLRTTFLYKLVGKGKEMLKFGITWNRDTRYTKKRLKELEAKLEVVAEYDDRAHARKDERTLVEEFPGPLNHEPWAGKGIQAAPGFVMAVVSRDPYEAGAQFGNMIDPAVQDARKGFNFFARGRWLDDEDREMLGM